MIVPDLLIRTNRRSLSIIINKEGKLIVRAPKKLNMEKIVDFVKQKEKWIVMKQNQINQINSRYDDIRKCNAILFLGKKYFIKFIEGVDKFELVDNFIFCPFNLKDDIAFVTKLIKWYYEQCDKILINRYNYFLDLLQINANSIKFINSKVKWGSCDNLGNIKINYKTIMLPHDVIDYILIHELCHVLELNHSERFYKLIECVMPNYKSNKRKIIEYNFLLNLYR